MKKNISAILLSLVLVAQFGAAQAIVPYSSYFGQFSTWTSNLSRAVPKVATSSLPTWTSLVTTAVKNNPWCAVAAIATPLIGYGAYKLYKSLSLDLSALTDKECFSACLAIRLYANDCHSKDNFEDQRMRKITTNDEIPALIKQQVWLITNNQNLSFSQIKQQLYALADRLHMEPKYRKFRW